LLLGRLRLEGLYFKANLGKKSQPMARPIIKATQGSTNRRIIVQAGPAIKQDPISKITTAKGLGASLKW
jgi:hypothetical protein